MGQEKKVKVCFAASTGGHYEQLLMLKPLMEKYDSFVLTEETLYKAEVKGQKMYYMKMVNRKEASFLPRMLVNTCRSIKIYLRERPDAVICTGVLAMIPMCMLVKLMGGKLIYIESFARVTDGNRTGKLIYKFADLFIYQWEQLAEIYPEGVYGGGIY